MNIATRVYIQYMVVILTEELIITTNTIMFFRERSRVVGRGISVSPSDRDKSRKMFEPCKYGHLHKTA